MISQNHMNKNNKQEGFSGIATIGIVAAVVAVVIMFGYSVFTDEKTDVKDTGVEVVNSIQEVQNEAPANEVKSEVSSNMPVPGSNTPETIVESEQSVTTASAGSYEAYSGAKIAMASVGDVVLFFHASWCPSCKALNGDIEKNLSAIPAVVTILKTDYDKEVELKKKYGVTHQHTLVQVDKDGNLIKKWSGGSKLENLLSQIQ